MAANSYYHGGSQQPPGHQSPPYYDHQHAPSSDSELPQAYNPRYADAQYGSQYGAPVNRQPQTGASPFDTVFDDPAYPTNSNSRPGGASNSDIPQQGFYQQDTGYHGSRTENIPLQDHHTSKSPDVTDHIYDVPAGQSSQRRDKRGKVQVGELGMLGANKKRIPWLVYIFSVAQVAVFIAEIVRNGLLTGSPIMIKPQFNPMIGPSTQVLINMGARYVPCMHNIKEIQGSTIPVLFLCPNATKNTQICPLSELCGFGGGVPDPLFDGNAKQSPAPNQWWRFIIPIFMHAGLIHIGFNLLMQLTIGKEMEMAIGSVRFFLVYMSAGIFGFIMGGNYAAPGIASTGASGSLFGIIALTLIDLLYSWKDRRSPVKDLLFIIIDMVISFVLGLLPGLDNFSHIGGFLMGLVLGISILHSPNSLRRRIGQDPFYSAVPGAPEPGAVPFHKSPIGFFRGRKPLWWAWWLVRAAALVLVIVVYVVLLNNFYKVGHTCSWCKYLSCLPVNGWCDLGTIQVQ
ncbi:rhomboid family membrane [Trichoderma cornu-damae]|uniref:Rhomboid-type serine protease n=1 Tax=Trichoderma cornu-damae TaxID=654480 RepID=A0A9P8QRQ8_9HYPO|nr:rhomboid family membrane [Trichoderma cornu-damae]